MDAVDTAGPTTTSVRAVAKAEFTGGEALFNVAGFHPYPPSAGDTPPNVTFESKDECCGGDSAASHGSQASVRVPQGRWCRHRWPGWARADVYGCASRGSDGLDPPRTHQQQENSRRVYS